MRLKILGIIPARGGSKGIKNKNIKNFCGKPLIYWTIKTALKSNLDNVIVSTDSFKIKKISEKYDISVPFLRPAIFAKDNSSSISVVKHALKFFFKKNISFDAVMILQPTCPLRTVNDINECISILKKNKKLSSVISLQEIKSFFPDRMKYLSKQKLIINPKFAEKTENLIRQKLRKIYIRSGLIYLSRVKNILEEDSIQGKNSYGYITPLNRSYNIDDINDFKIAELVKKKQLI